jgi:hypothetical protein
VVGHEVEAVAIRLLDTHSCLHHEKASVGVGREKKFTTTVGLHSTDTKEAADALSKARGHVRGVQCMDRAVDDVARCQPNRNPH